MAKAPRLTPDDLYIAYQQGLFPMGDENARIGWYRSHRRAILPMDGPYVSTSFRKHLRRVESGELTITFDQDFEATMRGCLRPPGENWITEELIEVYGAAHREGWAHSCEVWRGELLVGGTYGLALGQCFCAESMFHRETNASKVALWAMIRRCRELGFQLFDAQVINPHLSRLGAIEIDARDYSKRFAVLQRGTTAWSRR